MPGRSDTEARRWREMASDSALAHAASRSRRCASVTGVAPVSSLNPSLASAGSG